MGTGSTEGIIPNNGAWGYSPAQTPDIFNQSTLAPLTIPGFVLVVSPSNDTTGVTDLANIQSALDTVHSAGGGKVTLKGLYYISASLVLYDSVVLEGSSPVRVSVSGTSTGTIIQSASASSMAKTSFTATTNSTTTLASVSSFTNLSRGTPVTGSNIPANTYIVSIDTVGGTAIMSAAATDSVAGKTITPWSSLINVNNTLFAGVRNLSLGSPGLATANGTLGISDFSDINHAASLLSIDNVYFYNLGGACIGLYGNVNFISRIRRDNCASHFIHLRNSGTNGTGSDNFIHTVDSGYCLGNGVAGAAGDGLLIEGGSNNSCWAMHLYNSRYGWHIKDGSGNRLFAPRTEKNDLSGGIIEGSSTDNQVLEYDSFHNGFLGSGRTASGVLLDGSGVVRNHIQGKSRESLTDIPIQFPGMFTADMATSTTLSNVSSFVGIRNDALVVGPNVSSNTYIVSFNSGAGTILLNKATTATASAVALGFATQDMGVGIQNSPSKNSIDVEVTNVNQQGLSMSAGTRNLISIQIDNIGKTGVTLGSGDGNHIVRANIVDAGQRATATYDAIAVNAGDGNFIENLRATAVSSVKINNGVNISSGVTNNVVRQGDVQGAFANLAYTDANGAGTSNTVRGLRGFTNTAPVVAVPLTTVAIATYFTDRYFYVTAGATACTIAVSAGPTVIVPALGALMVFVPAGATLTPTYTDAPTWVVHAVAN